MMTMRKLRERLGLTTADVASALGIADSTVRNWDYGRTIPRLRVDQFVRLLKLYQVTPEELLDAIAQSISHDRAAVPRSDCQPNPNIDLDFSI
jgi:transcriptional regulator with XRE-family HTH domain